MKTSKIFAALALLGLLFSSKAYAMTLREKVGQLFIIRPDQLDTTLTPDTMHNDRIKGITAVNDTMRTTLKEYPAGGFALFRKNIDTPRKLRDFTAELRDSCHAVPFMAVDEEGGRIARIANAKGFKVRKFASTQAIGRTGNAREAAEVIGEYLKDYGFNMDFAPVADINTNPENIVIGDRAFGDDPEHVSRMASEYLDGLHSKGIIGSIKHFPGHGDTKGDTHSGYVAVNKTWDELLRAELIPFTDNFRKADTVMIAHITMKNVTDDDLPASLSRELVTGKLRGELGYDGVVIVDALMMGAVKDNYTSAEAAVMAIDAGCDILLMPYDYREAFDGVIEAVKSGRLTEKRIDESVARIMKLKEGI